MKHDELKALFNSLPGTWSLERVIQDGARHGMFNGECVFSWLDDARLLCEESGTMNLGGHSNAASRSYIYELRDNKIIILYNDPHRKDEVLHELDFDDDNRARHCHVCVNDVYELEFSLSQDGRIHMDYTVKGPQKDYTLKSILSR